MGNSLELEIEHFKKIELVKEELNIYGVLDDIIREIEEGEV